MSALRRGAYRCGLTKVTCLIFALTSASMAQIAVTTYHNDNYRTGLDSAETELTPSNVNATQFGLLASVTVDDQVDAQPLVVPNVNITGPSGGAGAEVWRADADRQ